MWSYPSEHVRYRMTPAMLAVFAPVAWHFCSVLVIAAGTSPNMMLARGMVRQREIGIRLALGAGRRGSFASC